MHCCIYFNDFTSPLFLSNVITTIYTFPLKFRHWLQRQDRQRYDAVKPIISNYRNCPCPWEHLLWNTSRELLLFPFPQLKVFFFPNGFWKTATKICKAACLNIHCKSAFNSKQKTRCNKDTHHLTGEKKISFSPLTITITPSLQLNFQFCSYL